MIFKNSQDLSEVIRSKPCNKCKNIIQLTEFNKDNTRYDGLSVWCRVCTRQYNNHWRHTASSDKLTKAKNDTIKWQHSNRERISLVNAQWRAVHSEYKRELDKNWWDNNYEHMISYRRANKGLINSREVVVRQ